jgi:hypothetical protein
LWSKALAMFFFPSSECVYGWQKQDVRQTLRIRGRDCRPRLVAAKIVIGQLSDEAAEELSGAEDDPTA